MKNTNDKFDRFEDYLSEEDYISYIEMEDEQNEISSHQDYEIGKSIDREELFYSNYIMKVLKPEVETMEDDTHSMLKVLELYTKMQHDINNKMQPMYCIDLSKVVRGPLSKKEKSIIKQSLDCTDRQIDLLKQFKDFFIQRSLH